MNPELASYLAWIFLALIGLGVFVLIVLGLRWLNEHFKPQPFLSRDEQKAVLRAEAKNLFKEQEVLAEASQATKK